MHVSIKLHRKYSEICPHILHMQFHQCFLIYLCINIAASLTYLRMRSDVTFLTDRSIMAKVNTIQASSTLDSTHTKLLVKPVNIHIITTLISKVFPLTNTSTSVNIPMWNVIMHALKWWLSSKGAWCLGARWLYQMCQCLFWQWCDGCHCSYRRDLAAVSICSTKDVSTLYMYESCLKGLWTGSSV